jgi:putative endonuclease
MTFKYYSVYIMGNNSNRVLYTGVTNNLAKRIFEHKEKIVDGFTKKYNIYKLLYYEVYEDIENALFREKQIKSGSRVLKIALIESINPEYKDLYKEL